MHRRCTCCKRYARKVLSPDFICFLLLVIDQFTSEYSPYNMQEAWLEKTAVFSIYQFHKGVKICTENEYFKISLSTFVKATLNCLENLVNPQCLRDEQTILRVGMDDLLSQHYRILQSPLALVSVMFLHA